ncbi:MAG TPA: PilN domain-containing protein [Pyrinomonadaceae bacterium]|nr:PilN domain-containing protein [Pyrinomonadaceae bacterium]
MIKVNLLDSVTDRARTTAAVEAKVADPRTRVALMGVAVAALLGLAVVFDFVSARTAAARADEELAKQKEIAAQMAAVNKEQAELEKKIKDIQTRIEAIKVLRSSQQGPVALLSAMNERLPAVADFRLESVEQKGGELTVEGHSPNEYAVTQFGRSLEFSSDLFQNVSIETERQKVEIDPADYADGKGAVDTDYKPETVRFKIKCKYGPSQPPAGQAGQDKGSADKKEVARR